MAANKLRLKLLVDKERNRVVFAESDKDFVDVLLSFLTMPLGTIIRLSGKQSQVGCLDTLYESVENLELQFLQTEACKNMLLNPVNFAEDLCQKLLVNIDDTEPTKYYTCPSWNCCTVTHCLMSTVRNSKCSCGLEMNQEVITGSTDNGDEKDGVFVKGRTTYMISDDLQILDASTTTSMLWLKNMGIRDGAELEERDLNVGVEEVLHLLKRLLLSQTPFSDVFLKGEQDSVDVVEFVSKVVLDSNDMDQSLTESKNGNNSKNMTIKLLLSKSNKKVLYAEAGEEFPDLLFSFLTFPLGSVAKYSRRHATVGSLDNLYKSVFALSSKNCIKSGRPIALLLNSKLVRHFGCENQLIPIEEVPSQVRIPVCHTCVKNGTKIGDECEHGLGRATLSLINPKYTDVVTECGGSFMRREVKYMVTDELVVKPLSPRAGISLATRLDIPIIDLEEQVVTVGEEEAVSLLKASLTSKTVLSDVFYPKKPKKSKVGHHRLITKMKGSVIS